jgi:hypothetical protein
MQSENPQIIKISNKGWYVETRIGFDGPFDSINDAITFLDLIKSSNAARVEFAGLDYTPDH